MNVLIVYGTTEGQTRKIAEWIESHVRQRGHKAELRDSASVDSGLGLERFDAFIVAASVHHEYHQESVRDFVMAHRQVLEAKPSAFISVSLSVVLEGAQPEAQKYVETFFSATGWRPAKTLLLGGALHYTNYDYFQEQIVRFIVMKDGAPARGREDREFTDWDELAGFIDGFLAGAA